MRRFLKFLPALAIASTVGCLNIEQAEIQLYGATITCRADREDTPDDISDDDVLGSGKMDFKGEFVDGFTFEGAWSLCAQDPDFGDVYCVINFATSSTVAPDGDTGENG